MSCNSFHHKVEQGMRNAKSVLDFEDFVTIIKDKGIAYEMKSNDFIDFPNGMSTGDYASSKPVLKKVKISQFRKGTTDILWKECYEQRIYYEAPFLKKKITLIEKRSSVPFNIKPATSYVSQSRKEGILKKLCPLMPASRRVFWQELCVAEESGDK